MPDRMIAATAHALDLPLVSRDRAFQVCRFASLGDVSRRIGSLRRSHLNQATIPPRAPGLDCIGKQPLRELQLMDTRMSRLLESAVESTNANRAPTVSSHRSRRRYCTLVVLCIACAYGGGALSWAAQSVLPLDLTHARVVTPANVSQQEHNAVRMLVEEVEQRTGVRWSVTHEWLTEPQHPLIAVGQRSAAAEFAGPIAQALSPPQSEPPAEGYTLRIVQSAEAAPAILVGGNDARGVLFGIGRLLRALSMSRGRVELRGPLEIATAPADRIRGHQLGYRPKTNSYDGWDLRTWEQYLRDLAVFGCNAIELIPPRSDDADDSPHFPLPKLEMMIGMSRLADEYGLDVWIWYPALDGAYDKPEVVERALAEWRGVLSRLPRVDAIFVPTGDPGDAPPRYLMPMLEKQSRQLRELHPNAETWISMQSFTQEWFDEMMGILRAEPEWLAGIGYGPQTRVTLPKLRQMLPARYPIRRYPDITHSLRCEYPVPDWDRAFAFTEAREVINPRPLDQAIIYRAYRDQAAGFITYSEGCNDDVNKIVWSALGWDPNTPVEAILREYSRYFIGEAWADDFAQGLLSLERNWRGALAANEGVMTTLAQLKTMEQNAGPRERANWRFQQALYRAYYDAYERSRLIYETELEERATEVLRSAKKLGSVTAMTRAEEILDRAERERVAEDLRARVFELAEALFQSIRMQLSVERYQAIDVGRGANLDTIDVPLNNRLWLAARFAELRKLHSESERLAGINEIVNWPNPGTGGFYDDLGNAAQQPHLVRAMPYERDPGFLSSPALGFRYDAQWRLSWCTHADGLYDTPVVMRYSQLDPRAAYKIRVLYAGDNFRAQVRLATAERLEIHPWMNKPSPIRPVEFDIPAAATAGGSLTLVWEATPRRGGPGRGCQIAEVWLMKRDG